LPALVNRPCPAPLRCPCRGGVRDQSGERTEFRAKGPETRRHTSHLGQL